MNQMAKDILEKIMAQPDEEQEAYRIAMDLVGCCGQIISRKEDVASPRQCMEMANKLIERATVDMAHILKAEEIREEGET